MIRLARSFQHALRGIGYAFRQERSFRIQVVAAIVVIILMALFELRDLGVCVFDLRDCKCPGS